MQVYRTLLDYIDTLDIISTHSHKYSKKQGFPGGLFDLINNSYGNWVHGQWDGKPDTFGEYFKRIRYTTRFYWLEKGLQALLSTDERLNEDTFLWFDQKIKEFSETLDDDIFLREVCHYEKIILDNNWNPGDDQGNSSLYAPAFRVNMLLYGYSMEAHDDFGLNPFTHYGWPEDLDFEAYLQNIEQIVAQKKKSGCVALKSALAYVRTLAFKERSVEEAKKGYHNKNATKEEITAFQDYIYFYLCRLSAKYDMPFQNHTGLGNLEGSNAMLLREAIVKNLDTKFVLMHGSTPWTADNLALMFYYPNVYSDICWVPTLSITMAISFIKQLIEIDGAQRITWGDDTCTAIESYGAYLSGRHTVAKALEDLVNDEYITLEDAKEIALNIFSDNAKRLYSFRE